jgi:hypothetical protein
LVRARFTSMSRVEGMIQKELPGCLN